MMRLTLKTRSLPSCFNSVRHYSEGFEISKYLNRIEALTKRPPVSHKPRQPKKPAVSAGQRRSQQASQNPTAKTSRPQRQNQQGNNQSRPGQGRKPRTSDGKAGPRSTTARANTSNETNNVQSRKPEVTQTSAAAADAEWTSLDSADSTSAVKPLPRSNRRVVAAGRKAGSKAKTVKKRRAGGETARAKPRQSPSSSREYAPYLTPKEALEIVLRNEGTSSGGFIQPIDVSLSSLQPNLVQSAVTYNSRVRSLLNSVSPEVVEDRDKLKKLVDDYVSGSYDHSFLDSKNGSLSYRGLASEVFTNHSMDMSTRRFFADVGAGKLTPKQIASRA